MRSEKKIFPSYFCPGLILFFLSWGCGVPPTEKLPITISQLESLRDIETMLPLAHDSIVSRYLHYDTTAFQDLYSNHLFLAASLIDSLNAGVPDSLRVDTLAIDRSFRNFGVAGRLGKSIYISSSYFIMFDDINVLRSIIFHEFGHIRYKTIKYRTAGIIDTVWMELGRRALLYLFREGEYSGNARFGGHPEDSAEELYASAFNILNNCPAEFLSRLRYVNETDLLVIRRFTDQISLTGTPSE